MALHQIINKPWPESLLTKIFDDWRIISQIDHISVVISDYEYNVIYTCFLMGNKKTQSTVEEVSVLSN